MIPLKRCKRFVKSIIVFVNIIDKSTMQYDVHFVFCYDVKENNR